MKPYDKMQAVVDAARGVLETQSTHARDNATARLIGVLADLDAAPDVEIDPMQAECDWDDNESIAHGVMRYVLQQLGHAPKEGNHAKR